MGRLAEVVLRGAFSLLGGIGASAENAVMVVSGRVADARKGQRASRGEAAFLDDGVLRRLSCRLAGIYSLHCKGERHRREWSYVTTKSSVSRFGSIVGHGLLLFRLGPFREMSPDYGVFRLPSSAGFPPFGSSPPPA